MPRENLPNRRACEHFDFAHDGVHWTVSWARYPDGRLGEIFLTGPKVGTGLRIAAHDASILTSIALQHGTPAEALRSAMLRSPEGTPQSVIAAALDVIEGEGS